MSKRRFAIVLLSPILLFLTAGLLQNRGEIAKAQTSTGGHTWFIRPDGGDRKQCTGKVDAAYRGKGAAQPCAFNHPFFLFTTGEYGNKNAVVQGGDTILIRGGPYRIGYTGPNPNDMWGLCPGDPYSCGLPSLPSGTLGHPTRLLGEQHGNCKQKTQLYGGYAAGAVLGLVGSKNVEIECIELTDHGQCTRAGAGYPASEGCHTSYPLSDYASNGIITDTGTANVILRDVDIHGFVSRGIIGPIGGEIIVERVRIAFNGMAGWDFDDGNGTRSGPNASVKASYLTVEGNGCNEESPIRHEFPAFSCFDQDHGGYGDGIGTPGTQLDFSCDHCLFRYNTQDGFDLLHTSGSLISITNSNSYGNMGQQWKMGAMHKVIFQNNLTVNNCSRMSRPIKGAPANYNRYLGLYCRAGGDGIALNITNGGTYVFQNNSFAGYGATSYDIGCSGGCSTANIIYQNNINVGVKSPGDGREPGLFYFADLPQGVFKADHNIYYNMRSCPSGKNERCIDPKIANLPLSKDESNLENIDFHLTSGSPARGAGVPIQGLSTDHDGAARPNGALDLGAYQFRQ